MRKPLKTQPIYKGEKLDRTSGEILLCQRCSRFATHRARMDIAAGKQFIPLDLHFCDPHLEELIKEGSVRQAQVLTEYRRHVGRVKRWKAQADSGSQGALL